MTARYRVAAGGLGVRPVQVCAEGSAATWATTAAGPLEAAEVDLLVVEIPAVTAIRGFTSSWGLEFEPVDLAADQATEWQVASGRSSNGAMPWLRFDTADGAVLITVHWSGNWRFAITPESTGVAVRVGLPPDGQRLHLATGSGTGCPRSVSLTAGRRPPRRRRWSDCWPVRRRRRPPACRPSGTTGGRTRTPRSTRTSSSPRPRSPPGSASTWRCWTPAGSAATIPTATGSPSAATGTG